MNCRTLGGADVKENRASASSAIPTRFSFVWTRSVPMCSVFFPLHDAASLKYWAEEVLAEITG